MKKVFVYVSVLMLCTLLSVSNPVTAQQYNEPNRTDATTDDDGDTGKWGLAGLLGLIGLVGLKRRDDDNKHRYPNANPNR